MCGAANALMGSYVVAVLAYFCITEGWPDVLWGSLAVFGLLLGCGTITIAGLVLVIRSRRGAAIRRVLGLTALLGLPGGIASGAMYVFMLYALVAKGSMLGRAADFEFYVVALAFLSPLPISLLTACTWIFSRPYIDLGDAPREALHG